MSKVISKQKVISKVKKSGVLLNLCRTGAVAAELKKGICVSTVPISDFHVAMVTSDGKMQSFSEHEQVRVMFSNKYQICWVESMKPIDTDHVSTESDAVVCEWVPLFGKIIIVWAEEAYDYGNKPCALRHYLTADITENGAAFVHIEEMFCTKELWDTLMAVMSQLKMQERLDQSPEATAHTSTVSTE